MARFLATKRNEYTKDKIRKMRSERKSAKSKKVNLSDADYQQYVLGDLLAAGHIKIIGTNQYHKKESDVNVGGSIKRMDRTIDFSSFIHDGMGERPQMIGYLMSGSDKDTRYRLKGWFNDDGTIRLELVK